MLFRKIFVINAGIEPPGGRMLELDRTRWGFKMKTVYFADRPFDVDGVDWVNFQHVKAKVDAPDFERTEKVNAVVDLKKGPDHLWENMSSKCRTDIRKSENDDIEIEVNENFEEFIRLNSEFRKEKRLPPVFEYYLRPPLPDFCSLFTAKHAGSIVGGILFIKDDREMYAMLAASKRLAVDKEAAQLIARATRRLWWHAVGWGSEQGLSLMDLGSYPAKGSESKEEGVGEFKRRFGAEPVNCYDYRKLYSRKAKIVDAYRATIRQIKQASSPS